MSWFAIPVLKKLLSLLKIYMTGSLFYVVRNKQNEQGLLTRAQCGPSLKTWVYFSAPNPHIPHINQGQHAGSNPDCQPQETRRHFMWTFVGKCSIIYLTGVVVAVMVCVCVGGVFVCVYFVCVCVCVFIASSVRTPQAKQYHGPLKEERLISWKMHSCLLSVVQGLPSSAEVQFSLLLPEDQSEKKMFLHIPPLYRTFYSVPLCALSNHKNSSLVGVLYPTLQMRKLRFVEAK